MTRARDLADYIATGVSDTELDILDGLTSTTAELNYNDTGAAVGTVVASKTVTVDANKDASSFRNLTMAGDLSIGGDVVTTSNATLDLAPDGTGTVVVRGNNNSGAVVFNCESNSHGQKVYGQPHSAGVTNTLMLPEGANSKLVSLVSTDTLTNKTLTSPKVNEDVAVTSTATELNLLDGVTATTAELNILDGVTSTAAELNILDGVTSTAAELNILDGVTATAAELNILDGVTSTAAEINSLDGITAVVGELNALDLGSTAVGTAIASKAVILDSNKDYTGLRNVTATGAITGGSFVIGSADINENDLESIDGITAGTVAASKAAVVDANKDITGFRNVTLTGELDAGSLDISGDADIDGTLETDALSINGTAVTSTAAELNILDGVTATATELNLIDGVTATTAELNILDGVTSTAAELNILDGVTSTASELNKLDGVGTLKEAGKESIWIPSAAMYPSTTNPCSDLTQVETTALRPDLKVLDFATGADDFAQFSIAFPKSWNEGTITFQPFWTVTGTNTGTVAWGLSGIAVSNDDTINTAFGTAAVTTALAHSGTSNDLMVSVESGAVTIAGSPAANDLCFFQVNRDVSADNQSGDARLLGIKLFFTTDAKNDS